MSDAYAEGPGDLGGWPEKPTADPRESEAVQKRMEFWKRWFDVVHETPLIKPMFDEAIRGMLHAEYIIVTTQRELAEAIAIRKSFVEDWHETKENIRTVAKRFFPSEKVDGDSYGVPPIDELVDWMAKELEEARGRVKELEGAGANRYGVDVGYFARELRSLMESLPNRKPDELTLYLRRLINVAEHDWSKSLAPTPAPPAKEGSCN